MIALFLSILPLLLWDEGPSSAPALQKAGITQIAVTKNAAAWSATPIRAVEVDASRLVTLKAPGVDYKPGEAGPTAEPWINSNIWRMLRDRNRTYLYQVPASALKLAVAEAYAAGAQAVFQARPEDLALFAEAAGFVAGADFPPLPDRTNFDFVDDGSAALDDVMNLFVRRNLLFQPVRDPSAGAALAVRLGSPEYPKAAARDPYEFAAFLRARIGDERRLVRVYGSDTTLARLYGDATHARLHLVNYGRNAAHAVRVRVLGDYRRVILNGFGQRCPHPEDVLAENGAIEFTVPEIDGYMIADLDAGPSEPLHSAYSAAAPALTADPDSPFWRSAPRTHAADDYLGQRSTLPPTEIRSRWSGDSLYLLYICPFERLYLKKDPATDRETPALWDWDVAEAFLGGDASNVCQYREFQVSPQGEFVDLDIDCAHPKPNGGIGWNSGFAVKARMDAGRKLWYGEMKIPLSSIRPGAANPGDAFRLGLYRIEGGPTERTHVSWQKTYRRNYHTPDSFGALILDGDAK